MSKDSPNQTSNSAPLLDTREWRRRVGIRAWCGYDCTCPHPLSRHDGRGCRVPGCPCGKRQDARE